MSVNQAPLSVRNNNPGNLRFVGQEGASQGEGGFAKFETPEAGLAAMRNQIELDTQTRGLNLTEFLNKYAPPSENKTSNYIDFVVKRTGLDPAARVPVERIADLQKAMIEMEGGPRALSAFNMAVPPRTTAQKVAAPGTRTTVQAAKPAVQVAAAINPSELPSNYTSALALSYLSDTDPEGKIMGRVNEMLEEMQGGAAKPPGGATLQKFAQSERVDPFKLMAQAQQEEEPKQRKAVPRMPVRMATGGPVGEMAGTQATEVDGFANGGLAARALAANRPRLTETDYTKLKGIQSEFEDYNKRVDDYQKAIDAYNAKVEAYNAAGGEGVENPGEFTTAEPTMPGTTVEQAEAFKKEAEERAKRFYAARSTALQSIVNPEKYNLSGMSFGFEKGGEVNMDQQQAEFNATQDMDEYRKKSQEMLYNLRTNLGPVTGQFVPGRQGVDVRASTQVAGVRPFVDVSPNEMAVTRFGASYGRMGPQGGYDITVEQPAAVPTPAGPVNLPPSLRGVYAQPLGKDGTFAVEGMYSPGPNPQYRVGARLIKRFEYGGMANANPADIAEQMTVGTLPEDQRPAGEVFRGIGRDVVRGAQYLPYDLLGAPVDIATMAMRPFGYNVEKPVGGSEYLIEKARQAGIAQAPTGSVAETATRIGMGFVNPAAVARQIPKGIAALRKGAEALELPGVAQTAPVGAVKPSGGVVNADEMVDSLTNVLKFDVKAEGQKFDDIFKWIDTKARSYYEKQFGSPSDPLFRAFMSGDFDPQFNHINNTVRETYEDTIKHGRDLMSSTSTADQRVGRAMLSNIYDAVTPIVAQYGPQTIRNRLLNPKFREEIQRYIMEERNLGPAKLTPKARLNYEKEIDSYLDEFAKTGNLSTKAPFDVVDINKAASQNIVDDVGNKIETQTRKTFNLSDESYGFLGQWPGYGTALEKTHALPSAYSKNYPDYLATTAERQAVKFGEPTYFISKQPEEVHADLSNLIGYLNRTPADEWKNTSFPDLVVKAQKDYSNITDPQEIYKRLNNYQKVTPKQRLIGTQEFMPVESKQLGEGATWRELDENGILIEGRLLRHCLSEDEKYRNFYKNGMSRFFALRDKEGKSHATIQIDRLGMDGPFANVHQIKGWKNDSVGKKYDKEIMDFLNRYQANQINVPLRYTEESSFLPVSLAGGERVRVVEGDAPFVRQYVEFFRTLDRNLIDRGMATPEDLGDFNYVLDRIRDLPTEAQQKEFADTFLKAFAEGYNKPLKFIYHLGGWRTGQLGEPQPVWQNPPVNRAKGGMVDKPLYDRAA